MTTIINGKLQYRPSTAAITKVYKTKEAWQAEQNRRIERAYRAVNRWAGSVIKPLPGLSIEDTENHYKHTVYPENGTDCL